MRLAGSEDTYLFTVPGLPSGITNTITVYVFVEKKGATTAVWRCVPVGDVWLVSFHLLELVSIF
jgi:hypothetical protein